MNHCRVIVRLNRQRIVAIWSKLKHGHEGLEKYRVKVIEFASLAVPRHGLVKNSNPGEYQMHTNSWVTPPWSHSNRDFLSYLINSVPRVEKKKVIEGKLAAARVVKSDFSEEKVTWAAGQSLTQFSARGSLIEFSWGRAFERYERDIEGGLCI